uniref:Uncharacterized protein n=1 Tax=Staphylococcus staphylolyticus TaxID=1287 RepID=F1BYS8_STAST|nr:hypothetical protein [Staphylococcus simulans bv. staphylolyticus]
MRQLFYSSEILLVNKVAPPINIPMPKIKKPLKIAKRLPKDKKIENKLGSVFLTSKLLFSKLYHNSYKKFECLYF